MTGRIFRLRCAAQRHALYLALYAVATVGNAVGVVAALQNQHGAWLAMYALVAVLCLSGAIHHYTEVFRHADILDSEVKHKTTPP